MLQKTKVPFLRIWVPMIFCCSQYLSSPHNSEISWVLGHKRKGKRERKREKMEISSLLPQFQAFPSPLLEPELESFSCMPAISRIFNFKLSAKFSSDCGIAAILENGVLTACWVVFLLMLFSKVTTIYFSRVLKSSVQVLEVYSVREKVGMRLFCYLDLKFSHSSLFTF